MKKVIVIAGPTGSGKSDLARRLALTLRGEIVNYDSIQIYRRFDVGSAKPTPLERAEVPHHLFDIVDAHVDVNIDADDIERSRRRAKNPSPRRRHHPNPQSSILDSQSRAGAEMTAADFGRMARRVIEEIDARGSRAILAGGTFFYLQAVLTGLPEMPGRDENVRARLRAIAARPGGSARLHRWLSKIDPQSGRKIAPNDRHRVERALEVWIAGGRAISSWKRGLGHQIPSIKIALRVERQRLAAILDARVEAMYRAGLVEETRGLLDRYPPTARPFGAIGYKEAAAVVRGEMTEAEAIAETRRRTRAYAKRQMTWLRAEPNVHWIEVVDANETYDAAMKLISQLDGA